MNGISAICLKCRALRKNCSGTRLLSASDLDKFVKMLGTGQVQYNVVYADLEIAVFATVSSGQWEFAFQFDQTFAYPAPKQFWWHPETAVGTIDFGGFLTHQGTLFLETATQGISLKGEQLINCFRESYRYVSKMSQRV